MKRYIAFLMLVLVFALGGCILNVSLIPQPQPLQEKTVSGEGRDKIVLVDLSGFISDVEQKGALVDTPSLAARVKEELKKAAEDGSVRGLVLRVNSPGGTVTASDIIYHEVLRFKEATGVPVYAVMMDVGASGAYYASMASDRVYAHPTTITGSIGVIATKFNVQGLMEKIGVEETSIKSGEKKDIFSPFRPSTPEEQEILQGIIDQLHGRFVQTVEAGRKGRLSREDILRLADGRPYTALQAREAGLIDEIGYMDDALEAMKKEAGLETARVVMYRRPGSYKENIYSALPLGGAGQMSLISVDPEHLARFAGVQFLYLWRGSLGE